MGVGGDSLSAFPLDLDRAGGFVVAGGRGSGRSTALAGLVVQLHAAGRPVLVVAPRASVLTATAERLGVTVLADRETAADVVLGAVAALAGTGGAGAGAPAGGAGAAGVPVVVVDDADSLKQAPLEAGLTGVAARVRFAVALDVEAASSLFGGPYAEAKKARTGVLLGPTHAVQGTQVFGTSVPKTLLGRGTPGGGVLVDGGTWRPVRVPDPSQ